MAQQTAVEWLMQEYKNNPHDCLIKIGLFEQAKEMEKEQIEKSFDIGFHRGHECGENHDWHEGENRGSEYYEQEYLGKERINREN